MSGGMTCGVGDCRQPPVAAVRIQELYPSIYGFEDTPAGGVVAMCRHHFDTPPREWTRVGGNAAEGT